MTINPCCIPLKMGVRIVTHLSMALALCVGWSALKLMSISLEVSTEIATSTSMDAIQRMQHTTHSEEVHNVDEEMPPTLYNNYNFRPHHPLSPQSPTIEHYPFRIPYEYILFYNWYQQQLRQHHNLDNQPQQRHRDSLSSSYNQDGFQMPGQTQGTWGLENDEVKSGFIPPWLPSSNPHQPPTVPSLPPLYLDGKIDEDEDKQNKIFRSVLHHRKSLKEGAVLPVTPNAETGFLRNLKESEHDAQNFPLTSFSPTPSPLVQVKDERKSKVEEREHVPKGWSPFFLGDEKQLGSNVEDQHHFSSESPEVVVAAQLSTRHHQHEKDAQEMDRRMMSTFTRRYSQRDGSGTPPRYASQNRGSRSDGRISSKKMLPDFKEQYAKVLLLCGLLALCTVIFQFFTSFLLLCFVDKGSNAAAQIWTAVNCSVIFCLATCLILFLCEGLSISKYSFDETLYLSLVTVDSLLSIYFLWVVMAFI